MSGDEQGDVGGVLHQVGVAKAAHTRSKCSVNLVSHPGCIASIWH